MRDKFDLLRSKDLPRLYIFDMFEQILNPATFQAGYSSNSTEELNNEMRNLESVMKDLNAIAAPSSQNQAATHTQC